MHAAEKKSWRTSRASSTVQQAEADSALALAEPVEEIEREPLVPVLFPGLELTIASVEWERVWVTLNLEFNSPPPGEVDFLIYDILRAHPITALPVSETEFQIRINVTNFRNRQQVPNGSWRFMAVLDGQRGPIASTPLNRVNDLESSGRSYLYNQNRSTYVVTFGLSKDDRADVIMRTYQLNRPAPKAAKVARPAKPAERKRG